MKRKDYPIYSLAVRSYLACENREFYRLIDDESLTQQERVLLQARKLFSQGNYQNAVELLASISEGRCEFLNGELHTLLATANGHLGLWENSFLHNGRARSFYQKNQDPLGEFYSTYNLSVDASRLGLKHIGADYLNKASALSQSLEHQFLVSRARACQWSEERQYEKARNEIRSSVEASHECANKLDVLTLKAVAADIYFRAGDREGCEKLLKEIQHEKLLKSKARIFFNLAALGFLRDQPFGRMPKSVKDSEEYSLKWNILQSLDSGDLSLAQRLWAELIKNFPGVFAEEFACKSSFEEDGLFYQCLKLIRGKARTVSQVRLESGSKLALLHDCLTHSKQPLRKEEIIEMVWKTPYDPALDPRFYKLIQRLKDMSLPVANERRAYYYK